MPAGALQRTRGAAGSNWALVQQHAHPLCMHPRRAARTLAARPGAGSEAQATAANDSSKHALPSSQRVVIVQTTEQAVMTAAVEAGFDQLLFPAGEQGEAMAAAWRALAAFRPLLLQPDGALLDAREAERAASQEGLCIMDAQDWKVIPAENLVAAFQAGPGRLLGVAHSAAEARVLLEALEAGTAGVLLRTREPAQVKALAAYLQQRQAEAAPALTYSAATVTRVVLVGMADRVCVDLCSLLRPGEGCLVGSFARGLFLVHSECLESSYINSRPFRVNAGAVHAYIQAPGGRTAYLSELASGAEVAVADADGRLRSAIVGRCKIERRPMMLVEAETPDGIKHSTLLQNAETVRLVCRDAGATSSNQRGGWQAVSVSELQPGQQALLLQQGGARHTGISIQEQIAEK